MTSTPEDTAFEVVEICAGAGGQALGLEKARFTHRLAVELDPNAYETLRTNLPGKILINGQERDIARNGDVADPGIFNPVDHKKVALFAGGVPCPPFTIAGKQLGASDERDLFAWAVEQVGALEPQAVLLENVRGLSLPRFAGYRQHVLDRLTDFGYAAEWRLLNASDYGVPQLRPRFVLIAMKSEHMANFSWPEPSVQAVTVSEAIADLMGENGWPQVDEWAKLADKIAPTIVGGSKKHGGADLGPTRAKRAWRELSVDAMGLANEAPGPDDWFDLQKGDGPKLTNEMVARIQGWLPGYEWTFTGRKTSRYRQIGNAFPPPVAEALGRAIKRALKNRNRDQEERPSTPHDPVYRVLREYDDFIATEDLIEKAGLTLGIADLERRIALLKRDFEVYSEPRGDGVLSYRLGKFKAFVGQEDHERHIKFAQNRSKIS
ncbi:DNA (cytosine-5-)-methyltransferase [Amycolatopsis ultiminotia]|uniref:DNA (cytosine-5-)-methyltransferase n=1 Tax=Amycolatopsis ultiminotia TaxID=543629 RepID=A0ABP6VDU4_9PSEU